MCQLIALSPFIFQVLVCLFVCLFVFWSICFFSGGGRRGRRVGINVVIILNHYFLKHFMRYLLKLLVGSSVLLLPLFFQHYFLSLSFVTYLQLALASF